MSELTQNILLLSENVNGFTQNIMELLQNVQSIYAHDMGQLTNKYNKLIKDYQDVLDAYDNLQKDYSKLRQEHERDLLQYALLKLRQEREQKVQLDASSGGSNVSVLGPANDPIVVATVPKKPTREPKRSPVKPTRGEKNSPIRLIITEKKYVAPEPTAIIEDKIKADQYIVPPQVKLIPEKKRPGRPKRSSVPVPSTPNTEKRKPGRPKKVQSEQPPPESQVLIPVNDAVEHLGATVEPITQVESENEGSQGDKHIAALAQGDFTMGRKQYDDTWFHNKTDDFIAKMVACLYNNLAGKTPNLVENREFAIRNFIMGYNHVKHHTNYGYILIKGRGRIEARPKNQLNIEYIDEQKVLHTIGLHLDKDGYVKRGYGSIDSDEEEDVDESI